MAPRQGFSLAKQLLLAKPIQDFVPEDVAR